MVLDKCIDGRIDQVNQVFRRHHHGQSAIRYEMMHRWIQQLQSLHQIIFSRIPDD